MNNLDSILTQSVKEVEGILRKMVKEAIMAGEDKDLTINSIEEIQKDAVSKVVKLLSGVSGYLLSNIKVEDDIMHCDICGRKTIVAEKDARIDINSLFGPFPVTRDRLFCRYCNIGYGIIDKKIGLNGKHRMTNGLKELCTYVGQLLPAFERGEKAIEKLLGFTGVKVSHKTIQIISEEIGKEVFEKEEAEAKHYYENLDKVVKDIREDEKQQCILYISMDGSSINTRQKQKDGKGWKEIKLGLVFKDKDIIKTGGNQSKIMSKRYVTYLGCVEEFKKFIWTAAVKEGYGQIKQVVVLGDGAQWIWNLVEELFPDATACILDYYHFSENVYSFAKFLYPQNEIGQKRWAKQIIELVIDEKFEEALNVIKTRTPQILPDGIVNLYHYLTVNKERMYYERFKAKGYYIGSGCVESGHKVVIQQRMKQAGMRWDTKGAQYMAALRAKHESNLWDDVVKTISA